MKKFILGLILCILIWTAPLVFLFLGVTTYNKTYFIIAFVCLLILLVTKKPCSNLLSSGRQEKDYDEFGRSKRKQIQNLSRAEQDAIDLQNVADMERLLSTPVIKKITKKGSENPKKDLENMIGLNDVKQKVLEMSARMEFEKQCNKGKKKKDRISSMSGRHMVFYGSAGTGKTTIARIITGFLYEYGYIKKNKIVEVDGNFLKAGADTAKKVKYVTQIAYDGVLFIDEAYSLYEGAYGNEAVATLIKEMEDNRNRFVCILAGYTKDMNILLDSNTGFKSRIKEYLNFPDYSIEDMKEIFINMAHEQNFVVSKEAIDRLEIRLAKEMKLKTFGNGRTVRNILDESIDKHSLNYIQKKIPENTKFYLCGEDVSTNINLNGIT